MMGKIATMRPCVAVTKGEVNYEWDDWARNIPCYYGTNYKGVVDKIYSQDADISKVRDIIRDHTIILFVYPDFKV